MAQTYQRGHPQLPGAVESYRCKEHKIRPGFYVIVYDWRGRPREHFGHHHVRGALLTNGCSKCGIAVAQVGAMSGLSPTNAAEPEREPNVPDVLDMFGQPGLPRP